MFGHDFRICALCGLNTMSEVATVAYYGRSLGSFRIIHQLIVCDIRY